MKRKYGNRLRRGVTAVEMAMVSPVFFLLVFALVEFGRMVMIKQAITSTARSGCRSAVLATTSDIGSVQQRMRDDLIPCIPNAGNENVCRIVFSPESLSDIDSGTNVTATIEVTYSDISWFPASFLGSARLEGKATMVRE